MKKELRRSCAIQMKTFRKRKRADEDSWLCPALLSSAAYQKSQVIATYLSMPHEVSTVAFIKQTQLDGKAILMPKPMAGGPDFVDYDENCLQRALWSFWSRRAKERGEDGD